MDQIRLEPDSGRHPSNSIIETKSGLVVIKLEPKEESDMEPHRITDSAPDNEQHRVALKSERYDNSVEEDDLSCGSHFLAVDIKVEDGTWEGAEAEVKVEMDGAPRGDNCNPLDEMNGDNKTTWIGYVEIERRTERPRRHVNVTEEEKMAKKREGNRLRKRRYRASLSQEALAKQRERNRLSMRKIRASLKNEEIKRQTETDMTHNDMPIVPELSKRNYIGKRQKRRTYKRKPVTDLTPQQLQRQRERNRIYMRKLRASLSAEELERRREKDRKLKRRSREIKRRQKQDKTSQVTMLGHCT
jgi:hypothetical protein